MGYQFFYAPVFFMFLLTSLLMREKQEDFYLVILFASQLYFYILGPSSLLGY